MASYVVGLTGGVASGKSHVHQLFVALGVPVLEADDVGRAVVAPGQAALGEIAAHFGAEVLLANGELNRPRMREKVFAQPHALAELEAITHPHIHRAIATWLQAQTAPYCVLAAAILLERGFATHCQRVLVVDAPEADQQARLMRRDGIGVELAQQMMARQCSRAERLAQADEVIYNPDPVHDLTAQVYGLHQHYLLLAKNHLTNGN